MACLFEGRIVFCGLFRLIPSRAVRTSPERSKVKGPLASGWLSAILAHASHSQRSSSGSTRLPAPSSGMCQRHVFDSGMPSR